MLLICGDFNAKIGKERLFFPTIGRHSLHETTSENGQRMIELASSNNLVIKSTMFEHKEIHKQTWISNDGKTRNQIDHILINARYSSNITDIRSLRGADADSDHILVRAQIRARISSSKNKPNKPTSKWNTNKLQIEENKQQYQEELTQRLQEDVATTDIEESWNNIKEKIFQTTDKILGKTNRVKSKKMVR